jgi:DNA repair protein RAD51
MSQASTFDESGDDVEMMDNGDADTGTDEVTYQPRPIADLQGRRGIQPADLQKLARAGFQTIEAVAYTPKRQLMHVAGFSEQKAAGILAEGTFDPRFYTLCSRL